MQTIFYIDCIFEEQKVSGALSSVVVYVVLYHNINKHCDVVHFLEK